MKKLFLFIACFGITILNAQNSEVSKQDKEFTECAMMNNLMELKLSEMAMNKGFSPEVKELAQHMLADNKKADDLLRQLATSRAIPLPTNLDEKCQKEYKELSDKEGEDFDKTYTDWMIKNHKNAIDLYEKESKKGDNTELRAFATNALPSITNHKDLADATCKKLKKG